MIPEIDLLHVLPEGLSPDGAYPVMTDVLARGATVPRPPVADRPSALPVTLPVTPAVRRCSMSRLPMRAVKVAHRILNSSLLQYVSQCEPWYPPVQQAQKDLLDRLAEWQQVHTGWLELAIGHGGARPEAARWPLQFSCYNYCSLAHLFPKIIEDENRIIETLEECLINADSDRDSRTLLEEVRDEELRLLARLEQATSEDGS